MAEESHSADSNARFERSVLGAALVSEEAWDTISQKLTVEDFIVPVHEQLFQEIRRAEEEDRWGDPALISQELADSGIGEAAYTLIADLIGEAAPAQTLDHYISDLKVRTHARRMSRLGLTLTNGAGGIHGDRETLESLLAQADEGLQGLTDDVVQEPWVSVGALVDEIRQGNTRPEATFPTGFTDLDRIVQGGFRPGQMVVIAGRPAMGKSTVGLDMARHASLRCGIPGLFISLEMGASDLSARLVSAEGAISLKRINENALDDSDRAKIAEVYENIEDAPLDIIDSSDSSWEHLSALIVSAHRRNDIKYVILDYLQLCTYPLKNRNGSRQEEVTALSRSIKMLAKRLGITIVALAQLNRGSEQRSGNVPQVSDLRESGGIEQDADIVLLVHRADVYDPASERAGEADLIVGKQRNGPSGTATLAFQGHYSRFVNLAYSSNHDDGAEPYRES